MKYILPLEKEREKYHFEISNDGKELKKSNIIPVVNDNKSNLQNGVIYVESPFQKDEYFDITEFNQKSQDKWGEIIRELASKIGATKIKTTLVLEKEDDQSSENNVDFKTKASGRYKILEGSGSINNTNSSKRKNSEQLKSSLEFEIELKGEKQSIEEVEQWVEDEKIDKSKNSIFRILLEQFKNNNLVKYEEKQTIEKIITGFNEVNNTLSAIANIKSPLFSVNMQTSLNSAIKEEFRKYEKMEFKIEIYF